MPEVPVDGVLELQAALQARGWTQNEFARQLGTTSAVVSRWFTRSRKPGLDMALRIEAMFGIPASRWVDSPAQSTGTDDS
jgi:transcriptional regulator with XRE-family HTH domain